MTHQDEFKKYMKGYSKKYIYSKASCVFMHIILHIINLVPPTHTRSKQKTLSLKCQPFPLIIHSFKNLLILKSTNCHQYMSTDL